MLRCFELSLPLRHSSRNVLRIFHLPLHATFPSHLILLDFIIQILFREEHVSQEVFPTAIMKTMMNAKFTSETSVNSCHATRHNIPVDRYLLNKQCPAQYPYDKATTVINLSRIIKLNQWTSKYIKKIHIMKFLLFSGVVRLFCTDTTFDKARHSFFWNSVYPLCPVP
jgi:hypothetical protein